MRNSSFSLTVPTLQLAWDSTSLGALKDCPTKYHYSIVLGLVPREENIHLEFGLAIHGAQERFHHARARGASHEEALCAAMRFALAFSWDSALARPRAVFCNDKNKNRLTLLRTIVWYFAQYEDDRLETLILANGKPAVELSFSFDSGIRSRGGEPMFLCGHMDRLAIMEGVPYVCDIKTTKNTIGEDFFAKFTPHNQFSLYALAGKVEFNVPARGIIVDGIQVAVSFSRPMRKQVPRDEAVLDEWLADTHMWMRQAEEFALANRWPKNEQHCDSYGGCPYRGLCSKSPLSRKSWERSLLAERVWDPLQRRGDI